MLVKLFLNLAWVPTTLLLDNSIPLILYFVAKKETPQNDTYYDQRFAFARDEAFPSDYSLLTFANKDHSFLSPMKALSQGKAWIVTAYGDATALLKDPRFIKGKPSSLSDGQEQASALPEPSSRLLTWRRDMLNTNPPDHTRLRHLASKALSPRMIEQLRPRIQQITDDLLNMPSKTEARWTSLRISLFRCP